MSVPCDRCGAVFPDDDTCQSIFESFLVLEFSDPQYGEVHFLTVACYMIQHQRYSDEALVWIRQKLSEYLNDGISADQLRRNAAKEVPNSTRGWKITRAENARSLLKVNWSMTIADVALHYQGAQSYCGLVTQWARAVYQEMVPLLPG